jgi:hypothetical protein
MIPIHHLLDLQYVKRWNIVGTTKEDNVQSHSFRVAVIAINICNKMDIPDRNTILNEVTRYALFHDAEEAYTGDIATPVKDEMKRLGFNPNDMYSNIKHPPNTIATVPDIVKMADLIDNYYFIKTHGVGDRAREAEDYVHRRLQSALGVCGTEIAKAASEVIFEIFTRKSNGCDEERDKITQDSEEAVRRV